MRFGLLWGVLFFGAGCSFFKEDGSPVKGPGAPVITLEAKKDKPLGGEDLLQIVKLSIQADQIMREAWWVAVNERRSAPRSVFGKLQRAALLVKDGKLATKGIFSCDQYEKRVDNSEQPRWMSFYETCVRGREKKIAEWRFEATGAASVEFFPENLAEVVGFNSSVLAKRFTCHLTWEVSGLLSSMTCPQWEQDHQGQTIRFSRMEYRRGDRSLLTLRGQVLKELQPIRKIEAEVPLEGKIVVTETELEIMVDEVPAAPKTPGETKGIPQKLADPTMKAPESGRGPLPADLQGKAGLRPGAASAVPSAENPASESGSENSEELRWEDEMKRQGYVPVLGPDGQPLLGSDGQPLWDRPAKGDGLLFIPDIDSGESVKDEEPPPSEIEIHPPGKDSPLGR